MKRLASALEELIDLAQLRAGRRLSLRQVRTVLVALIQDVIADQAIAARDYPLRLLSDASLRFDQTSVFEAASATGRSGTARSVEPGGVRAKTVFPQLLSSYLGSS